MKATITSDGTMQVRCAESEKIDTICKAYRDFFGEYPSGMTVRDVLTEIDRNIPEAIIYWGCWTGADLNTIIK